MIGGIDEAGRGPVFGPLVVAGVACPDPETLWEIGVKDSKRLTPAKRDRIARLIEQHPETRISVAELAPEALDARRQDKSLNAIEVELFRQVALELDAVTLVLDAADVDAQRFGRHVGAGRDAQIISEHKADDRHAIVAAASIIAKTRRDAAIEELRKRLERKLPMELGSGYPSDPKTKAFLAEWYDRFGELPPGVRTSWKTIHALTAPKQSGLDAF